MDEFKLFFEPIVKEKKLGENGYLINRFFRQLIRISYYENELLPYINSLISKQGEESDDLNFDWGQIHFRYEHIMIIDKELISNFVYYPFLLDEQGNIRQDAEYTLMLDTNEVIKNYTTGYLVLSLTDFLEIATRWLDFLKKYES